MSDHAELREAARQSIDGCNEKLKALLADFDRVKAERDRLIERCLVSLPSGKQWWVRDDPKDIEYPTREAAVADLLKGSE